MVGGGQQAMNRTWRGVLTVKAVALSALFVGVVVLTVINRRRELHADSSRYPGNEGYPPHVRPGW